MELQVEELGKVAVTVNGYWDKNNCYDRLCIVNEKFSPVQIRSYISKKPVPAGIALCNTEYWMPFSVHVNAISKQFLDDLIDGKIEVPTEEWVVDGCTDKGQTSDSDNSGCDCTAISVDELQTLFDNEGNIINITSNE